jgi:site-specific DNA-methyltransferase (adenine-specific)
MYIYEGDSLETMGSFPDNKFDLIYMDPPFNTGKTQKLGDYSFEDNRKDYHFYIKSCLLEAYRLLSSTGSLFFHVDYREVHYCKVMMLDEIFGRDSFMNEIIWAYDYGGRNKNKWSTKHDNILWYVKDPKEYTFNYEEMDRIPYMAPGLVGPEKAARGKTPTDVWWHTIVPTNGQERTGYPTQKPLGIMDRIVKVHSKMTDMLLDPFAGSGSFGESAGRNFRHAVLVDNNPQAIEIMEKRLERFNPMTVAFEGAL